MRPLLAALLTEIRDDADAKRELAEELRPYLATTEDDERAERLLSATEKAAQLGLHPDTLVRMAREARIWATKVGREWRFRSEDLPQSRSRETKHAGVVPGTRLRRSNVPASVAAIRGQ